MWQPVILQPEPDPFFVRELTRIDPALRVRWAYERYLKHEWVIERRMSAERYFAAYRSLLEAGAERFVDQPIFDHDRPIINDLGETIGYEIIGSRRYDLAPEWEAVEFTTALDSRALLSLRRQYAWNRNHPLSRHRFEAEQRRADEAKQRDFDQRLSDIVIEACDEAFHDADLIVTAGMPVRQLEGTEL